MGILLTTSIDQETPMSHFDFTKFAQQPSVPLRENVASENLPPDFFGINNSHFMPPIPTNDLFMDIPGFDWVRLPSSRFLSSACV